MDSTHLKVSEDHERNLSSTEKSVFHLCPVLLQTDFLLEVWGA